MTAAFEADPGLVWQFYNYRRHMAMNVQPNAAHYALAEYVYVGAKHHALLTDDEHADLLENCRTSSVSPKMLTASISAPITQQSSSSSYMVHCSS